MYSYITDQWSLRCAPVHTSVHKNYFTVHRKKYKMKNLFFNDINFVFFLYIRHFLLKLAVINTFLVYQDTKSR